MIIFRIYSILGAVLIVIGLYGVLWGKGQEMKRMAKLAPSKSSRDSELFEIVVNSPDATHRIANTNTSISHQDQRAGISSDIVAGR